MAAAPKMRKDDVPESFGVFKPVDHIVLGFAQEQPLKDARSDLLRNGFREADLVQYTAQEMLAQIDRELEQATGAAGFGYEINLLKLHRELAERGHGWLIVHAPNEEQWPAVTEAARRHGASAAHRYGRLVVEELLVAPTDKAGL